MTTAAASQANLNQSGQNLIRILISSYFIGIALGLIEGTNAIILAEVVMPANAAHIVGSVVVFSLAYLVMIGMWLRPAALLLALTMFWSSYITNFGPQGPMAISDFWRDIVLISSLMLTYVQTGPSSVARRAMLRWTPRVRPILPKSTVTPRRVTNEAPSTVNRLHAAPTFVHARSKTENIFREDFDVAIAS
ncbi:MAG: hypothetical protein ACU0DI_15305 [Paracoccaceae bacterium]